MKEKRCILFSRQISEKKIKYIDFTKIRPPGTELFNVKGQKDRYYEANNLCPHFGEGA